MKFTFSPEHQQHAPEEIMIRGTWVQNLESPARANALRAQLLSDGHEEISPRSWERKWISAVHDPDYLNFLETAYERWCVLPQATPLIHAHAFAHRSAFHRPESVQGQIGLYLGGGSAPLAQGTWDAALASAHVALEAADLVLSGEREAYALCRPPGHHAYADFASGFCYLNNVAIAANYMAQALGRVAVLDIDVHHGNGTQEIFYRRNDVYFASIHGDPNVLFPFYAGYAEETGDGAGEGFNLNLPLPLKSEDAAWLQAIESGLSSIASVDAKVLLVSLGFDAFKGDPSSDLAVSTEGFRQAGLLIGAFPGPVVLIQEGGYLVAKLGENLHAFLDGFFQTR